MSVRLVCIERACPSVPPVLTNPFVVTPVVDVCIPNGIPIPVRTGVRFQVTSGWLISAESVKNGPIVFGASLYEGELVVFCSAPMNKVNYLHTSVTPLARIFLGAICPEHIRFVDNSSKYVKKASANSNPL